MSKGRRETFVSRPTREKTIDFSALRLSGQPEMTFGRIAQEMPYFTPKSIGTIRNDVSLTQNEAYLRAIKIFLYCDYYYQNKYTNILHIHHFSKVLTFF